MVVLDVPVGLPELYSCRAQQHAHSNDGGSIDSGLRLSNAHQCLAVAASVGARADGYRQRCGVLEGEMISGFPETCQAARGSGGETPGARMACKKKGVK